MADRGTLPNCSVWDQGAARAAPRDGCARRWSAVLAGASPARTAQIQNRSGQPADRS
jgi:hypothetical protein